MSALAINLLKLYIPLVGWVGLGLILGYRLPKTIPPYLGKFLFWVGVPFSIMVFLRQADLSGNVWVAPAVAWTAIALGAGLGWIWINRYYCDRRLTSQKQKLLVWSKPTQGSFLLAAMVGNTGYLGYPVILTLVGTKYFAWAIFYDTLGSTLGAYGLGAVLAAQFGMSAQSHQLLLLAILKNPALWSFWLGLGLRSVALPFAIEQTFHLGAWAVIALSLLLLGMRLSQLTSWKSVKQASVSLSIKMLIVPLIVGISLPWLGVTGWPHLVLVLQSAMPPAFATLVLTEAYDLDRELTVTALAMGSIATLLLLPIWLWLFSPSGRFPS
jgi:malate permease and related proteins